MIDRDKTWQKGANATLERTTLWRALNLEVTSTSAKHQPTRNKMMTNVG